MDYNNGGVDVIAIERNLSALEGYVRTDYLKKLQHERINGQISHNLSL